ncbi:MAG: hypothetical protein KC731_10840 [Myxococcales bacterium]|nr:hypothetical protein [Myxococcales bacterium]
MEAAKNHMAAGVAFLRDPDGARYEEAYPEFRKAYENSGSLNALQNLAICSQKLELDGEAIEYYKIVLAKKGDDLAPEEKAQIERDLAALQATVAWVSLSADRPGVTLVDTRTPRQGNPIRNTYHIGIEQKKFGIHPGNHKLVARAEGMKDSEWTVQIANGGDYNHEFRFDPATQVTDGVTPPQPPLPPVPQPGEEDEGIPVYVWVAGGVTLAAAIPWAVFMGLSASKKSDYDALRGTAPVADQEDARSSLKTTNLLADVFLGITAAGAVTTGVLLAIALTSDSGDSADASDGPKYGVDYTIAPMADGQGTVGAAFTARF